MADSVKDIAQSDDSMGTGESHQMQDPFPFKLALRVLIEEDGNETVAYEDPRIAKQNKEGHKDDC